MKKDYWRNVGICVADLLRGLATQQQSNAQLSERLNSFSDNVRVEAMAVLRKLGLVSKNVEVNGKKILGLSDVGRICIECSQIISVEEILEFYRAARTDEVKVISVRPPVSAIVRAINQVIEIGNVNLSSYQNAQRLLTRSKNAAQGFAVALYIAAIAVKLERGSGRIVSSRFDTDDWFKWPDTSAPEGDGSISDKKFLPMGMLRLMGYRVGIRNGVPLGERRRILRELFERPLPPVFEVRYMEKWGPKTSAKRLRTLAYTLAHLTKNLKYRHDERMDVAIGEYEQDLDFLYTNYYVGKFRFDWPST